MGIADTREDLGVENDKACSNDRLIRIRVVRKKSTNRQLQSFDAYSFTVFDVDTDGYQVDS
jgi:hypothetical protein